MFFFLEKKVPDIGVNVAYALSYLHSTLLQVFLFPLLTFLLPLFKNESSCPVAKSPLQNHHLQAQDIDLLLCQSLLIAQKIISPLGLNTKFHPSIPAVSTLHGFRL